MVAARKYPDELRERDADGDRFAEGPSNKGPLHMFTFEPDGTGTTLTFGWDASKMTKIVDAVLIHMDKTVQGMPATTRREVEALP